ncbi:sensor domain-containing diguanylate cyclase [Hydrogenovibrio halophilus]|uniref:sensor domain-containing diguanylate cyclase n=1 Tax=Hydrogenovibrio halophilus TaxID=373391 RepID=UPI000A060859|nr:diguanylate cyclase [Hydrogenovibrio halophilus]
MPMSRVQTTQATTHRTALLLTLVLLVVLSLLSFWLNLDSYQSQKRNFLHYSASQEQSSLDSSLRALSLHALTIYKSSLLKDSVFRLMAQAHHGTEAEKTPLRQNLYQRLLPTYKLLSADYLRQLHFHLPGSISFLRFHRPSMHGDDLSPFRHSINYVNDTLRPISGFEEGRIFNGLRHVFPIMYQSDFVGTVEISFAMDALFNSISHNHAEYFNLLLKKSHIEKKVRPDERDNYQPSEVSDQFLVDKRLHFTQTGSGQSVIPNNFHQEAPKRLSDEIMTRLHAKVSAQFAQKQGPDLSQPRLHHMVVSLDQEDYLIHYLPLYDIAGQFVGYIVNHQRNQELAQMRQDFWKHLLTNQVLLLLLSWLGYFYLRKLVRRQKQLAWQARTDSLTGVYNRTGFKRLLYDSIAQARVERSPLSVIFFDLDHFKQINDEHGHLLGDQVLKHTSDLITEGLTRKDIIARWGGEEFAILLPDTRRIDAYKVAERLRQTLAADRSFPFDVTASFGVHGLQEDDTIETFMQKADALLYQAKNRGRNCVVVSKED